MTPSIQQRIADNYSSNIRVVVFPRSEFEANKKDILSHSAVITHFNYKRGDMNFTAVCLKSFK